MQIKRQNYLNRLINKKGNGLIKVVTGIRRCGKSYLLFNLFHEHLLSEGVDESHIIEVALDDRTNIKLRDPDNMLAYVKGRITDKDMYYIILDEVQLLDEFEDVLNSFLHIRNADVYVTGSNSKFLSSDVITEFRGRGDEIRVYPLSFREFMSVYDGSMDEGWDDYFTYGGLPLVLSCEAPEEKAEYLISQFKKVYLSDLIDRHKIRNADEFDELLDILASAIGSLTNPLKLANTFKSVKGKTISDKTLKKYLDYLIDAFLVSKAKRYDVKGKRYINSPAKYYFEDVGLRNARLEFRQNEENHIMENIIYNELRIRGFRVDVGLVENYGKDSEGRSTKKQLEVDFVATKGSKKYYIQSAFSMANPEKIEQEQRSLKSIHDSFKKIIVVRDNIKPRRNDYGIVTMGICNFLLDENSLDL
ncbi:MAG: ATP-binding protein [Clostridia bacterium]|nr:ATP-binding protein [Clostridia bacterium]MBQ8290461.1 ATP-binding protein [Clostridia bacterium]